MMKRELAWRIFAEEYAASTLVESSEEEKSPTYLISPLGARMNRVFVVGTLVEVMNYGSDEEPIVKAVIADPTGHFYLNTGQYNQEAGFSLLRMDVPNFVAVVGKVHVYEPEPGVLRRYIRPELVKAVDEKMRNRWIVETVEFTKERIEAMKEAVALEQPSAETLISIGIPKRLAVGAARAVRHYGNVNINNYWNTISEALRHVLSEKEKEIGEDAEMEVKEMLEAVAKGDDVYWEDLKKAAKERGIEESLLESEIDRLIRQGVLYERKMGEVLRIDREDWD